MSLITFYSSPKILYGNDLEIWVNLVAKVRLFSKPLFKNEKIAKYIQDIFPSLKGFPVIEIES